MTRTVEQSHATDKRIRVGRKEKERRGGVQAKNKLSSATRGLSLCSVSPLRHRSSVSSPGRC